MADGPLTGKVVIVTGAGSPSGMGRAMTLALVGAGARVAMLDIDEEALARSANTLARSAAPPPCTASRRAAGVRHFFAATPAVRGCRVQTPLAAA